MSVVAVIPGFASADLCFLLNWLEGVLYSLPVFSIIIGGWLGLLAVRGAWRIRRFLRHAVHTEGRVVQVEEEPAGKRSVQYRPIITFSTQQGYTETFRPRLQMDRPVYEAGQVLPVVYNPDDPQQAFIHRFWHLWLWPVLNGFSGLFFLLLSLYLLAGLTRSLG
jgi:hypothetical protein